eukprot:CAMPEP_0198144908 /NCGR_PEP_ID=MMETSP1443-20131203/19486_1 /TAXON_ID=186043 /ORGANISM="Entomoneis sp., Strain CCMP2396" /LENGTH=489 /DNA_ID=CAMNT_0043808401 /DNA_START=103 /DNA_END=1572 /DNA_ORIENTATION=-
MEKLALRVLLVLHCTAAFSPQLNRYNRRISWNSQRHFNQQLNALNGELSVAAPADEVSVSAQVYERTRPDFEILRRTVTDRERPLIYLDSGATSQKPNQVIEAVDNYYRKYNSNVHRGAHTLSREATSAYEDSRDKLAKFIGATSREEVIFTSGATESINLIAQTYGRKNLGPGDEVLLTVAEHHANLVPWQILAEEKGFKLRFVKINPKTGRLDLEQMDSLLNEKTKIVGFQHVSNVMAFINPVKEMVAMVRAKCPDAKVVLDACQSVPHMKVNVKDLGVDFLVASGHKMCAPTGIGFLWGKLDLLNSMPPYKGGGEMIDQVTLEGSTWLPSPSRFEAGTPPIAQAVGLGAAIDYLESVGFNDIELYEHELGEYLYERLSEVPGLRVFGPKSERVPLAAFSHESVHASDLSSFLDMEGVAVRAGHHCCQPLHRELGVSHSCRASLAFYNTKEEIDSFVKHLNETIRFFDNLSTGDGDASGEDDFVPFI